MMRRALEWFGGSVLVYVVAAACSSSGGSKPSPVVDSGMGGEQGTGGVQGAAGEGIAGERDGGLMNPVPDAMAAAGAGNETVCDCPAPPKPYVPPDPIVVEAECDITGGSGVMFAEAEFPGKTAEELARVVAFVEFDYDIADKFPASAPAGYPVLMSNVFVKDGFAATSCGSSAQEHVASRVIFTLP